MKLDLKLPSHTRAQTPIAAVIEISEAKEGDQYVVRIKRTRPRPTEELLQMNLTIDSSGKASGTGNLSLAEPGIAVLVAYSEGGSDYDDDAESIEVQG